MVNDRRQGRPLFWTLLVLFCIVQIVTSTKDKRKGSYLPICKGLNTEPCDPFVAPKDCADIKQICGNITSGIYYIFPVINDRPVQVYCDMETDGGGWLVFQRRLDDLVDFYQEWDQYKKGFGDIGGSFWLGNDLLSKITLRGNYELRVDMKDFEGDHRYARYDDFKVNGEEDNYNLTLGADSYSGDAGDSLTSHNKMHFTTKDKDHDTADGANCANVFKGGWWYAACHASNLNGLYLAGPHVSYADGIEWYAWKRYHYSLKSTEMKIRPV